MTPALFIKPDGKVYLIIDCPEEPSKPGPMSYQEFFTEYYEDDLPKYSRELQQAKDNAILIENQEYAWTKIMEIDGVAVPGEIYPMPGLKYKIEKVCTKGSCVHSDLCYAEGLSFETCAAKSIIILEEPVQ